MPLFIACILLYQFGWAWYWYVVACAIFLIEIRIKFSLWNEHAENVEFLKHSKSRFRD